MTDHEANVAKSIHVDFDYLATIYCSVIKYLPAIHCDLLTRCVAVGERSIQLSFCDSFGQLSSLGSSTTIISCALREVKNGHLNRQLGQLFDSLKSKLAAFKTN